MYIIIDDSTRYIALFYLLFYLFFAYYRFEYNALNCVALFFSYFVRFSHKYTLGFQAFNSETQYDVNLKWTFE